MISTANIHQKFKEIRKKRSSIIKKEEKIVLQKPKGKGVFDVNKGGTGYYHLRSTNFKAREGLYENIISANEYGASKL